MTIGYLGTWKKKKKQTIVFYHFVNWFSGDFCWDMFSKLLKSFKTFNFREKQKQKQKLASVWKVCFCLFSCLCVSKPEKKFIFKCDDKSVSTVSLFDRFRTPMSLNSFHIKTKQKQRWLSVSCMQGFLPIEQQTMHSYPLPWAYFGVLTRWVGIWTLYADPVVNHNQWKSVIELLLVQGLGVWPIFGQEDVRCKSNKLKYKINICESILT